MWPSMTVDILNFVAKPVVTTCLGLASLAHAAEPPLPQLMSEQPLSPISASSSGFVLPAVPKAFEPESALDTGARVLVRDVRFVGNTVFSDAELRAIAQAFLGRSLGALELEELRRNITLLYIEKGYINSGALLSTASVQSDGMLQVTILEGRLSQVRLRGLQRLNENYVASRLVPNPEAPLNVEALRERYQLLLSDPLLSGISTRLVPDVEQGKAILDVEVTRARPYQLTLSTDNHRSPSVGESAQGVSGLVRNLTSLGDTLSANWQGNPNGNTTDRYGLNWAMPLNNKGTQLTVQIEEGSSTVTEATLKVLDIKSKLSSSEVGVNQTVVDNLRQRLSYGLARSDRTNSTWLLGVPFSFGAGIANGVLSETTWKAWQDFTYRTDTSVLVARITRNLVQTNLTPAAAGADPNLQPPVNYGYWVTQLNMGHRLTQAGTQLQARATVQSANTRVTSLDGMGIGGANTVRGYRENQLLRDQGAVVNLELDVPMLSKKDGEGLQLNLVPFFDWGQGNNIGEASTELSSAGLSVRAEWHGLSMSFAVAQRLKRPASADALTGTIQDKSMHFQLSYNIF
jgi:hemolysin activation/secretion protein